jgi:glycosyltransferase involved in cell wall biosynthesis
MHGSVVTERVANIWLDVSTSWRARGAQANGTLRVERSYAAALAPLLGDRLRFCRYDRTRARFVALAAMPDFSPALLPARSGPDRGVGVGADGPLSAGRRLERAFREWRRAAVGQLVRRLEGGRPSLEGAQAGDVLLMVGENWTQYDFEAVRALRRQSGMRIAALCQDLIPEVCPQFFDGGDFVARYRRYAKFLVSDVDLVVAISQSTRNDILRFAAGRGGLAGEIATVQLGADLDAPEPLRPAAPLDLAPGRFVISVSTVQSRKNFDLLYHLWRRLSAEALPGLPTLVIVGRRGFGSSDLLWQIAHDPLVRDTIAVLHSASDAELAWLYRHCLFTLYPSFYEGWGLPVSESLAHGKYCIASNASSLPEAGQGLACHLDPLDLPAWREAVTSLIASPERLRQHEAKIAREFRPVTWAESAEQLVDVLHRMPARDAVTD